MKDRRVTGRGRHKGICGTALTLALLSGTALAQPVVLPGAVQPGRDRPLPTAPSQPDFDFTIEAPHRSSVPRAVDTVHFTLHDIRITGAHALPPERFRSLYAAKLGQDVSLAYIFDVADGIERAYRDAGYILVRAYVPPQRVKDGVFTINVVEGHIAHVAIQGGRPATQAQVQGYLSRSKDVAPLPLATIERGLLLSNDLPGVAASGTLKPSDNVPGGSDIVVDIDQPLVTGGLGVDNRGSRFSGLWTLNADAEINSVLGNDQLAGVLTTSPDASEQIAGQLRYRRAIGDDGVIGSLVATVTRGQPGSSLAQFGVLTNSTAFGPRVSWPLLRTRAESLQLDGGLTIQDAQVTFDIPDPVTGDPKTRLSRDRWRVLDVGATWLKSDWLAGSWSATLDLSQGLPGLGATPDDAAALSRKGGATDFTKLTGLVRYIAPLGGAFSAVLTAQGQYSLDPLINGELISFGGIGTGRGYDPGGITGDQGLGGSVELRYDHAFTNSFLLALEPYVFFDGAGTWYIQRGLAADAALKDQSIASVGGGVRTTLPHDTSIGLEVARTLTAVPGSDAGREATKVFLTAGIRF